MMLEGVPVEGTRSEEEALSRTIQMGKPKVFIATQDGDTENAVRALLEMEGWEVVKFSEVDEMMIACQVGAPTLFLWTPLYLIKMSFPFRIAAYTKPAIGHSRRCPFV